MKKNLIFTKIFQFYIKNIISYTMEKSNDIYYGKKTPFNFPTERYLNIVKRGYKDCKLNSKYLKNALRG